MRWRCSPTSPATRDALRRRPRQLVALALLGVLLVAAAGRVAPWPAGDRDRSVPRAAMWWETLRRRLAGAPGGPTFTPTALDPKSIYRLRLWVPRAPAEGSLQALEEAVAAFSERRPNVEVSLEVLDYGEGPARLAEALARGDPPDVYADDGTWGWREHRLRVPLDAYFPPDAEPPYLPAALAAVSHGNRILGAPRFVAFRAWVANGALLGARDVVAPAVMGWTWDEARNALAGAGGGALRGASPLVFVPTAGDPLLDLVVASGVGPPFGAGGFAWRAPLDAAARWLDGLDGDGLAERGPEGAVSALLRGRAAVLAGANPALQRALVDRLGDPALLPPPSAPPGAPAPPPLVAGAYLVFYQEPFRGDATIQAAVDLALHLSAFPDKAVTVGLLAIPAHLDRAAAWHADPPVPPAIAETLWGWAEAAGVAAAEGSGSAVRFPSPSGSPAEVQLLEEVLRPAAQAFLAGRTGLAEFQAVLDQVREPAAKDGKGAGPGPGIPVLRWFRRGPRAPVRVAEGVTLAGHAVGGRSAEEVRAWLEAAAEVAQRPPQDARRDPQLGVIPALDGVRLAVDATLAAALAAGPASAGHPGARVAARFARVPAAKGLDAFGAVPVYAGHPDKPQVTLAVNVAWGEDQLPAMLEVFEQADVKATFFLVGRWARRRPDDARAIARAGHEIANHGDSDLGPPTGRDRAAMVEDIRAAADAIHLATGVHTRFYSPHLGALNDDLLAAAAEAGHRTVMWTVDTVDWRRPPPAQIVRRVMGRVKNGAIILMHPIPQTVEALPELIRRLKDAGYAVVPLSELLDPALPEALYPALPPPPWAGG